jgi:SAM-dependent methyltransferase
MPTVEDLYNQAQTLKLAERDADRTELANLAGNWKDPTIPDLQSTVSDHQMARFRGGDVDAVFASLVGALRSIASAPGGILDAACATGYYSEVVRSVWPTINYLGSDYSDAMIAKSRERYPRERFQVEDATKLSFADRQFGCVLLSGALEHIPNYAEAIAEICRVAKNYVVLHRVPIIRGRRIRYTIGSQYSIATPRIYYPRSFIRAAFRRQGFKLVADRPTYARPLLQSVRMAFRSGGPDIRTIVLRRAA